VACESKIEKGNEKNIASVDWDMAPKWLPIYDSKITNKDEILLNCFSGYDSENSMQKRLPLSPAVVSMTEPLM
jgi:hypothetical protein